MKKLSIEEKAKAYDKALKRAEILIEKLESDYTKGFIYHIFPELKESEDEMIRKALINLFSSVAKKDWRNIPKEKIIAWLEKQGEQQGKSAIKDVKEEKVDNTNGFRVGQWIVNNKSKGVFLIKDFNSGYCTLEDIKGNIFSPCEMPFEEDWHVWTIEDAKDGDVLQLGAVTVIFKEFIGNENCRCYCSFYNGEFEIPIQDETYGCYDSTPATKEQRDILFTEMKEAGYKWDSVAKEPKRVTNFKN